MSCLEEAANEVEDYAERERHQQHRDDRNVNLRALTFVVNVAGQLTKPIEAAGVNQKTKRN